MDVLFTHAAGWSRGNWRYNGMTSADFKKRFGIDPSPVSGMRARISTGRVTDNSVVLDTFQHEPYFMCGAFPVLASVIWASKGEITLEVK